MRGFTFQPKCSSSNQTLLLRDATQPTFAQNGLFGSSGFQPQIAHSRKFLLDTNFILGMLKETPEVVELIQMERLMAGECAYSAITRMELCIDPAVLAKGSTAEAVARVLRQASKV